MKPDFFRTVRRPYVKVKGRTSNTDRVTRLVNSLLYEIIIFQTKTTFLQDLHIVWYMVLMFTNSLSVIKVFENRTR